MRYLELLNNSIIYMVAEKVVYHRPHTVDDWSLARAPSTIGTSPRPRAIDDWNLARPPSRIGTSPALERDPGYARTPSTIGSPPPLRKCYHGTGIP